MVINKHEQRVKEFIKIRNKLNELYQLRYKAKKIPLEEPYQKGWIIKLVLAPEILRRKDAYLLKNVASLITEDYKTNDVNPVRLARKFKPWKQFLEHYYKYLRSKHKNIPSYLTGPTLIALPKRRFDSINEDIKKYFDERRVVSPYNSQNVYYEYYSNLPAHYLEVKVVPNMITHRTELDPEIKQLESYLDKKSDELYYQGYAYKWRNYGASYPASNQRTEMRAYKSKFLKGEVEDIPNFKPGKLYEY